MDADIGNSRERLCSLYASAGRRLAALAVRWVLNNQRETLLPVEAMSRKEETDDETTSDSSNPP